MTQSGNETNLIHSLLVGWYGSWSLIFWWVADKLNLKSSFWWYFSCLGSCSSLINWPNRSLGDTSSFQRDELPLIKPFSYPMVFVSLSVCIFSVGDDRL